MVNVSVVSDHVTMMLGCGECNPMLAMQNQGWKGQKAKSWHGAHEVVKEPNYLEMNIQSQTHQT